MNEVNSNATSKNSNAERQACYRAGKLFKTLPLDVQRSIERLSDSPEEKERRTAIAIDYQKNHGKRPSTGMDCRIPMNSAKPGDDDYKAQAGHEEYCDNCDGVLPRLEQPRQYPGKCLPCVIKDVA